MQTFLPYPDFDRSARVLDKRRLGKQRVENLQIMQALFGKRLVTTYAEETGGLVSTYFDKDDNPVKPEDFDPELHYSHNADEIIISTMEPAKWFLEPTRGRGWQAHPAVRMWKGYERGLYFYQAAVCAEWCRRGYKDTCFEKTEYIFAHLGDQNGLITPSWMGDPGFHTSHQSNLIRKDRTFYEPHFPGVPGDIPYIWPV